VAVYNQLDTDLSRLYDEIADFFASSPSPEAIMVFQLSEDSERLISTLLEVNRTRGLTHDERAALDDYTRLERLMQAIKVRAFAKVRTTDS